MAGEKGKFGLKKVAFHTLGCKVNQVETEQLKEEFNNRGYSIVDFNEEADIYVINTCTVTHVSDRKSRAVIRRAARKNPDALVIAAGCLAQVDAEQLAAIKGVNLVVGNQDKDKIVDLIENYDNDTVKKTKIIAEAIDRNNKLVPVMYTQKHRRTRAFVKIQDGCESFCSYCIVPFSRGPIRSKLPDDVVKEINQLISLGYREIVLTGIHTGFYGKDLENWNLIKLLKYIFSLVKGEYRIRLSSVEPLEITEELIDIMAEDSKLCRHLHIPLQSGSNKILKAMNRRYNREYYYDLVTSIANRIPGIAFTADVMVGFPLEEAEDFQDTFDLLNALPIFDLHVFKYSPRPGTKAAAYCPVVSEMQKHERSNQLLQLAADKHQHFIKGMLGQEFLMLVERSLGPDIYTGLTDNYIEVECTAPQDITGTFARILINKVENSTVIGELIQYRS